MAAPSVDATFLVPSDRIAAEPVRANRPGWPGTVGTTLDVPASPGHVHRQDHYRAAERLGS
jgi:hypothetical protein